MSSRRASSGRTSSSGRRSALEEIRRLRDGGGLQEESNSRIAQYQPQEQSVFKHVTEEEYEAIVRQRRDGLPFVENDDSALGYFDDGEEAFFESDEEGRNAEGEEDDGGVGKKRSAGALSSTYARRAKKMQRAKLGSRGDQKITNMFFSASSKGNSTSSVGVHSKAKRDIDLDSLLDDLTSNPTESRQQYARPVSYSSGSSFSSHPVSSDLYTRSDVPPSRTNDVPKIEEEEDHDFGFEHDAESMELEPHKDSEIENVEPEEENEDETKSLVISKREMMLRKAREAELQSSAATARALADPQVVIKDETNIKTVPSNEVAEWWNTSTDMSTVKEEEEEEVILAADTIQMYWMDAVEVRDRPGKIYLIGKIKVPNKDSFVYKSCCVVVNNLERYMYLIPRVSQQEYGTTTLDTLSKPIQQQHWMNMHQEIRSLLIPSCITNKKDQELFRTKLVERNYAFEQADIPRGKHVYLKVKYPAKYPCPPMEQCTRGGQTYHRICGASTRPLETFLLRRKLLGPGWIEIQNVRPCRDATSYCSFEYETFDPKHVTVIHNQSIPPPLTVMSLSIKSICHPTTGKHEILALSLLTENDVNAEGNGQKQKRSNVSHFTAIRPLDSTTGFPQSYLHEAKEDERFKTSTETLRIELNERAMLSYVLNRIQRQDPDVIVGHHLHKYTLDVFLSRIDHYHLGGIWSKLTRLRRGRLTPINIGEGWNEYRLEDMINGRLFVDTYVSAKELLPSQNNYTLSHLVQTRLHQQRLDVNMNDLSSILQSGSHSFVQLLKHTLDDAMFILQLMHQLEILPLSKQLANLCGYLWPRTLEGNKRAERIEYLLLHEFNRSKHKFIVPDKYHEKRREKASYAGGMVFAPKKGLYDNFVVLLDFNSLYPSIIREYNICFTTVERQLETDEVSKPVKKKKKTKVSNAMIEGEEGGDGEDGDDALTYVQDAPDEDSEIPPLPSSSCEEGVLPGIIKRLLESRKLVKQQIKQEQQAGHMDRVNQLDIRQKAIKLTANSMYGCLGFRYSRFYAKPIAALITATGRQTLQRAKEVAEQECGYDVIYGDTDSIMVDSRTVSLEDAKRIGREIQLQCNKHFKLLELEVDYIFKSILLLNKKKYAALVLKESNGTISYEKEVKGLDMVRRDWCVISKTIGMEILDFILSGNTRDDVIESIHEHLQQVAERIRSGTEPIEQFVITKSLNKQPEQYPDRAKQYHVQVALALRSQGQPIGIGSHIPYVLCCQEEPGTGRRAYHPDEVVRSNGTLTIDVNWYLESQIHPPVNRLCAHIEGTSSPQLAHCLGLDTAKFSHTLQPGGIENDALEMIPSVLQQDAERFKDCIPLEMTCKKCQQQNSFPGVYSNQGTGTNLTFSLGLVCVNPSCGADFWGYDQEGINGQVGDDLQAVLSNRLHLLTRHATKKYYDSWVVCSDVMCKTRTQKQSLRGNGNICSAPRCRSLVHMEYSDQDLYTQIKYFASLFDIERAQKKAQDQYEKWTGNNKMTGTTVQDVLPVLSERHRAVFKALHNQAQEIVRQNDYNWVKPSIWETLFT